MAPAIIVMVIFFILPIIYVLVVSCLKWNGISAPQAVGVENFVKLLKNSTFQRSLKNNVIWALVAGFIQVPLAMVMAIILSRKPRGWKFSSCRQSVDSLRGKNGNFRKSSHFCTDCTAKGDYRPLSRSPHASPTCSVWVCLQSEFFRTVYFFPQVISGIALATLWRAIYNAEHGMLNGLLSAVGLDRLATDWLGNSSTAFPAVLIYWVFYVGYYMVIMMADITTIDTSYYEAATIDGATDFQQAIHITIPLIKKTSLLTCVTLASVMGLRQFEQVYMLTNGGPNHRTSTMVLYMYERLQSESYGLASATAVILIVVGVIFIVCIRRLFNGRSETAALRKKARRAVR